MADSTSMLTVVGASAPADAGAMENVIEPAFRAAFPQYTIAYNGSAPQAAVQSAENGTGGPSVLLVQSPARESSFVSHGFSYNNQFGNAAFTDDYVLVGTTGDPAGAGTNAPHNVAAAFADIAAAGVADTSTFDSRGGTNTAPAATVEEHQLWALMAGAGLTPAGVTLCQVTAADGGGETPITSTALAADPQAPFCPTADGGIAGGADLPSWYRIVSGNQANNVTVTNACTATNNGSTHCYLLTDRGTFDFLASGTAVDQIPNLGILTRENEGAAPGGAEALEQYFHAYVINPAKPGETVNLAAAQDFVSLLTSPALQAQMANYLVSPSDPGGAPIRPDASPTITSTPTATLDSAGQPVSVSGTLTNSEPGYPVLAGQEVTVDRIVAGAPVALASGLTNFSGAYSVTFTPPASGSYEVSTGALSQIEMAGVEPFGDVLAPAASAPFSETVTGAVAISESGHTSTPGKTTANPTVTFNKLTVKNGTVTIRGSLSVPQVGSGAVVQLLLMQTGKVKQATGRKAASTKAQTFKPAAKVSIGVGKTTFVIKHKLRRGFRYKLKLEYIQPGKAPTSSKYKYIAVH
jgi:ABC-type tungstate transport system permease subunit